MICESCGKEINRCRMIRVTYAVAIPMYHHKIKGTVQRLQQQEHDFFHRGCEVSIRTKTRLMENNDE